MKPYAALLFFLLIFCLPSVVLGEVSDGFEYRPAYDGIEIVRYLANEKEVVIPMQLGESTVVGIAESAFEGAESLEQITMTSSITYIGERAFAGCANLYALGLSSGIQTIGDEAFAGCTALVSITLPASLESIGRRVFAGCVNIQYILDLTNENLKMVGSGAFDDTLWLKNETEEFVTLSQGGLLLKYQGSESRLLLPWNYFYIAEDAFAGNDTVESLQISNYLRGLQEGAISGMSALTTVNSECTPEFVEEFAFRDLPLLETVYLNGMDLSIENFLDCPNSPFGTETSGPYDIELPDDADSAFLSSFSSELNGVVILHCLDSAAETDGSLVFPERIRGKRVAAIGAGACQNRDDIKSVVFPKYLKRIESWAFAYDYSLSEAVFPDGLEFIGADAFTDCAITENIPDLPQAEVDLRAFYQTK